MMNQYSQSKNGDRIPNPIPSNKGKSIPKPKPQPKPASNEDFRVVLENDQNPFKTK